MPQHKVPLLEGEILEPVDTDDQLADALQSVARLEQDLQLTRTALENSQDQSKAAKRAIANLRRQLGPLYNALRAVFGEIALAGDTASDFAESGKPASSGTADPRWEEWKRKLGPRQAELINGLLVHGAMTRAQMEAALHWGHTKVSNTIYQLNRAQLLSESGGRYSLRTLP